MKIAHVVVVSVDALVGDGQGLISGASVGDIVGTRDGVGDLVKGSSTADVTGGDGGTAAKAGRGDFVVEDAAVVDLLKQKMRRQALGIMKVNAYVGGGDESISDGTRSTDAVGVAAAESPGSRLVGYTGEDGTNSGLGVGAVVGGVERVGAVRRDVGSSTGSERLSLRVTLNMIGISLARSQVIQTKRTWQR